jgi:hypothetical protein
MELLDVKIKTTMQLNKSFIMESSKHYEAAKEVTAYR